MLHDRHQVADSRLKQGLPSSQCHSLCFQAPLFIELLWESKSPSLEATSWANPSPGAFSLSHPREESVLSPLELGKNGWGAQCESKAQGTTLVRAAEVRTQLKLKLEVVPKSPWLCSTSDPCLPGTVLFGPGKDRVLGPANKSPASPEKPLGTWLVGISQHHAWQGGGSQPENAIIPGN